MDITPEWLAGFFDGEGCVCASLHGTHHRLIVTITNCDLGIMMTIAATFPNANIVDKAKFERRRSCIRLAWNGYGAKKVLEYIRPHVRVKKEQVEAALAMIETIVVRDFEVRRGFADIIKKANNHDSDNGIKNIHEKGVH